VGPQGLGLLLSAANVGQLLGSLALAGYGGVRRKGPLLSAISALYVASVVGFALSPWLFVSTALIFFAGIPLAVFSATRHALLQQASPDDMRGRIMGTHLLVTRGLSPISQTVTGLLAGLFGPTVALLLSAGALGLVTIGVLAVSPALWGVGSEAKARPEESRATA
jgi:MFS family permease